MSPQQGGLLAAAGAGLLSQLLRPDRARQPLVSQP